MRTGHVMLDISRCSADWVVPPGGTAPRFALSKRFPGIVLFCIGIIGACTTKKGCACFATLYFCFMLLMNVFMIWAVIYLAYHQ